MKEVNQRKMLDSFNNLIFILKEQDLEKAALALASGVAKELGFAAVLEKKSDHKIIKIGRPEPKVEPKV